VLNNICNLTLFKIKFDSIGLRLTVGKKAIIALYHNTMSSDTHNK